MNYLFGESDTIKRKLRCRIGPDTKNLQTYNINDEVTPHFIDNEIFTGNFVVRVKGFKGFTRDNSTPITDLPYFKNKKRMFSIQFSGRFKQEFTAEDIVFGTEFEHKVSPPTGAWVAIKFATLIDPALQTDIYCDKPWLYSPLLCAMNIVKINKNEVMPLVRNETTSCPSSECLLTPSPKELLGEWVWKGENDLMEDNRLLLPEVMQNVFASDDIAERRKYFQKAENREKKVFLKDRVYNFEIFAPFIDLNTFDLNLGININIFRYLNDQPLRLMAKSQALNKSIFVIEFDLLEDPNADKDSVRSKASVKSTNSLNKEPKKK
ncbi:hypothetical protein HK099_002026 [Clydaea vesicula]|uniref:Domain of unknown function at the cortex 1 domain-containing protein n=1 Tax=Clydaea vesicula TaxID=447962 RepID=A0AAD5TTU1_9FUNG|nr:hypothetical protein HK099_002026 [Clydaea vesicula]